MQSLKNWGVEKPQMQIYRDERDKRDTAKTGIIYILFIPFIPVKKN